MTVIKLLSILIASIAIYGFTGYGFTRFLAPSYARGVEAALSLFVGLSVVVLFSHLLGYAGLNAVTIAYCILALSLLVNLLAFLKRGRAGEGGRTEVLPFILAAPVLFFALYPEAMLGYLTVVGPNGDSVGYSMYADHLMHNPFGTPPAPSLEEPENQFLAFYYYRSAFAYVVSVVNAVIGLKGYQTFPVVAAMLLYLNALAVHVVCRLSGLSSRVSNLSVFLVSLNGYLLLAFFQGFGPQMMSLGLIAVALAFIYQALDKGDVKSVALASLFSSTLITAYPDSIAFAGLPAVLFLFWFIIKKRSSVASLAAASIKIAAASLLLNPVGTAWGYKTVRMWLGAGIGAVGGNVSQMERVGSAFGLRLSIAVFDMVNGTALGFTAHKIAFFDIASMILLVLIALLSVYYIYKADGDGHFISLVSAGFFLLASFFYFKGSTYVFYKSLILILDFFVVIFSAGAVYALDKSGRGGRRRSALHYVTLAGLTAYAFLNILNSAALSHMFYQRRIAIKADTIGLKGAETALKKDDAVYIPQGVPSEQLWEMYFLSPSARIHWGAPPEDGGMVHPYQSGPASGDHILMRRDAAQFFNAAVYEKVFRNGTYSLLKKRDSVISSMDASDSPLFPMVFEKGLELSSTAESVSINGKGLIRDPAVKGMRTVIVDYDSDAGLDLKAGRSARNIPPGKGRVFIPAEGEGRLLIASRAPFTVNGLAFSSAVYGFQDQHSAPSAISMTSGEKNGAASSKITIESPVEADWDLALDIYGTSNHTHPDGHLGWGSVRLLGRKTYDVEFSFNPPNAVSASVNGQEAAIDSWKGAPKDGDYTAFAVLRGAGRPSVIKEVPAFEFGVEGGRLKYVAARDAKKVFYQFVLNDNGIDVGDEAAERFLVSGWSKGEERGGRDFAWGLGERSEVYVEPEGFGYKYVRLNVRANDEKKGGARSIAVSLNGSPIGAIDLKPGWDSYALPIPESLLTGNGVRLTFSYTGFQASEADGQARRAAFDSVTFE